MKQLLALFSTAILLTSVSAKGQQTLVPQLNVGPANRTLSVSATEEVSVEPDLAVLHIGFNTQPEDAKSAYADGARVSNAIIASIKQAGISEDAIRSESQYLSRDPNKPHKFTLNQQWTVSVPPERAAEILDIAISAGATSSGQIDWMVKDEKALEDQALDHAASRAKANAEVLAKSLGERLGSVIYVSNASVDSMPAAMDRIEAFSAGVMAPPPSPLSIEPRKVVRNATVYAIFAIE
jgi:uncharacterized protein YggE